MSDLIEAAQRQLWEKAELRQTDVERLLGRLADRAVDIGELFFQAVRNEAWVIEDGIIKEGAFSVDRGVGVRAVSGERTGFAYADDILLPALEEATIAARSIVRSGGAGTHRVWAADGGDAALRVASIRSRRSMKTRRSRYCANSTRRRAVSTRASRK